MFSVKSYFFQQSSRQLLLKFQKFTKTLLSVGDAKVKKFAVDKDISKNKIGGTRANPTIKYFLKVININTALIY